MENSLMITILSNVVNQAPKVNQETVDNVKAIITHLEKSDFEPNTEFVPEPDADEIPIEKIPIYSMDSEPKEPKVYTKEELGEIYPKKNKGGRPKKKK